MLSIKTSAGIVVLDKLQSAQKSNLAFGGWSILLYYEGKREPIVLRCKDETDADKSLEDIYKGLEGPTPASSL